MSYSLESFRAKIINLNSFFDSAVAIADFRNDKNNLYIKDFSAVKTFLSSGTTSSILSRSRSQFSQAGLEKYRIHALANFFSLPHLPRRGICLIPKTSEWPDSSLAQMLEWISEEMPVHHCSVENFPKNLPSEAHWIFGTAFHYVQFFDLIGKHILPKGSFVFETGGTKNQTREVANSELDFMISSCFGVDFDQIYSEYGMCELASQAYGKSCATSLRTMRFPHDVKVCVLQDDLMLHPEGEGILFLKDSVRADVPHAILTEDRVVLSLDGSFEILGRVEKAPLKGCSMRVVNFKTERSTRIVINPDLSRKFCNFDDVMNFFLQEEKIVSLLEIEFSSLMLAQQAYKDLIESLPQSAEKFKMALAKTGGEKIVHACFILPENHSLVGLYPLCMALAFKMQISVKPPKKNLPLLNFFLNCFKNNLNILDSLTKFEGEALPYDRIFVYGDALTKEFFEKHYPNIVKIFGPGMTVTVSRSEMDIKSLVADCTGLRQRGCKSCRGLIVIGDDQPSWDDDFSRKFLTHLTLPKTSSSRAGLSYQYLHEDLNYLTKPSDGFLIVKKIPYDILNDSFFINQEFTLPICSVPILQLLNILQNCPISRIIIAKNLKKQLFADFEKLPINAEILSHSLAAIEWVEPGRAQIVPWDGTYELKPLFAD